MKPIDHVTLLRVSGGAKRVTPRATDPTLKTAVEAVKTSVEDLARNQASSSSSDQLMPMMMMMMMRR